MSRIDLTTIGSLSDLHPNIAIRVHVHEVCPEGIVRLSVALRAIALELRQHGHDVVFVTHQVYQSKIEALGFEFHGMRPDLTGMDRLYFEQLHKMAVCPVK